jgi:hypothetical protein
MRRRRGYKNMGLTSDRECAMYRVKVEVAHREKPIFRRGGLAMAEKLEGEVIHHHTGYMLASLNGVSCTCLHVAADGIRCLSRTSRMSLLIFASILSW